MSARRVERPAQEYYLAVRPHQVPAKVDDCDTGGIDSHSTQLSAAGFGIESIQSIRGCPECDPIADRTRWPAHFIAPCHTVVENSKTRKARGDRGKTRRDGHGMRTARHDR